MSETAFNSDKEFGGGDGGPTGYDDYEFHLNHYREGKLFSLLDDDKLVAGAILKMQDDTLYIYRIFVDSTEFHKGYGLALMKAIEEKFSAVKSITLIRLNGISEPIISIRNAGIRQLEKNILRILI